MRMLDRAADLIGISIAVVGVLAWSLSGVLLLLFTAAYIWGAQFNPGAGWFVLICTVVFAVTSGTGILLFREDQ